VKEEPEEEKKEKKDKPKHSIAKDSLLWRLWVQFLFLAFKTRSV
jgi:hypothetical protein